MVHKSFFSKIFSHPDKILYYHLKGVAEACEKKFLTLNHSLDKLLDKETAANLIWLMGFCHDWGKATIYFQEYLKEEDNVLKEKKKNEPKTHHALISSIFAYWIAKEYLKPTGFDDDNLIRQIPFYLFLVIKKHHGNINNLIKTDNDNGELYPNSGALDDQLKNINFEELDYLLFHVNDKLSLSLSRVDIPTSLKNYFETEIRRKEQKRYKKNKLKITENYLIFQFLYSLLLHSDKEDVIFGQDYQTGRKNIEPEIVDEYIKKEFGPPSTEMDVIKGDIFREANQTITEVDLSKKIYSLNVPTGTGKTLTSLSTALKLRARLANNARGAAPRIIYALPFTSIIDQNFKVFNNVLNNPNADILLKHHHLADIFYNTEQGEFETDESKFLIESWESEIVVTTFFQVFHTLFTNRNKMIQKFHKLAGSIVLLDEVQSIPYKYWELVREMILKLAEHLNVYFILITATQPHIFSEDEIVELVPRKNEYFAKLDRVNITFHPEPIVLDDFIELCAETVRNSDENFLFVMNTINTSVTLFEALEKLELDAEYVYLSTGVIPIHRGSKISRIKESKNRKIVVSTQLIEAGVDIDLQNVWRDFGPLESINQVCGRCNRSFGSLKGDVRIFEILNGNHNNIPFSRYIYGKVALSLSQTKESLGNRSKISESDFLKNMDSYYQEIKRLKNDDESIQNMEYLKQLRFYDLYRSFKLIDDQNYQRKDVFIEFDTKAAEVWQKYIELNDIDDFFARQNKFLEIKKQFYDYVIAVPAKYVNEPMVQNSNLVYIKNSMVNQFYKKNIGWSRTNDNWQDYFF